MYAKKYPCPKWSENWVSNWRKELESEVKWLKWDKRNSEAYRVISYNNNSHYWWRFHHEQDTQQQLVDERPVSTGPLLLLTVVCSNIKSPGATLNSTFISLPHVSCFQCDCHAIAVFFPSFFILLIFLVGWDDILTRSHNYVRVMCGHYFNDRLQIYNENRTKWWFFSKS